MDSKESSAPGEAREETEAAAEPGDATEAVNETEATEPEAEPAADAADASETGEAVDQTVTGPEEEPAEAEEAAERAVEVSADELLAGQEPAAPEDSKETRLRAMIEAAVYVTEDPLTERQIAEALEGPLDDVKRLLAKIVEEYDKPEHGLVIREVADGFKMGTKAEHHEAIRAFVKKLRPPLKLV